MKKVNFVLPFLPSKPGGGSKIMYEYANRLALKGYDVTILHSIKRPYKKSKTPVWLRQFLLALKGMPAWFTFAPTVKRKVVPEISDRYVPDAEATISTWWQMTFAIAKLSASKGKKINLIQDYETWTGQVDRVHESYTLPVQHVVIARYLAKKLLDIAGRDSIHIPNAIDTTRFQLKTSQEQRKPHSIIMLYSKEERKGSQYGLEAMKRLKNTFPDLTVSFFSVFEKPTDLPEWINYHCKPDNLPELYNQHAIFFSPSLGEGWALPPAEAMACGCAVVCTDIGGHHDYAMQNETALLIPPKDVDAMEKALQQVLTDVTLKNRLARAGYENMHQQFSWQASIQKLESLF